MIRSVVATVALTAAALACAPPAAAGQAEFLQLRERLPFLSEAQLLSTGQKVCQGTAGGVGASDLVKMTQRDLGHVGVTVASATDIVTTAIIQLGC